LSIEKKKLSNKKKLMIVVIASVSILVFSVVSLYILRRDDTPEFYTPPPSDGYFAPVDWNADALSDPAYLELGDRLTVYADAPPFGRYPITSEGDLALGHEAELLYRVIESIRAGNHELYNSFFSDFYLRVAGEKGPFTQQKLYDIELKYEKTVEDDDAGILKVFRVGYKILDNNGTYRNDIASDELRFVYFYVRQFSGRYEVYSMVYTKFN
jgi:hypothetical protein